MIFWVLHCMGFKVQRLTHPTSASASGSSESWSRHMAARPVNNSNKTTPKLRNKNRTESHPRVSIPSLNTKITLLASSQQSSTVTCVLPHAYSADRHLPRNFTCNHKTWPWTWIWICRNRHDQHASMVVLLYFVLITSVVHLCGCTLFHDFFRGLKWLKWL